MASGYLFTQYGSEALGLFEDERVRFAARLSDGSGFAAFDGESLDLMEHGTVLIVQDFIHPFFVPKRWHGMGREVYSLLPLALREELERIPAVTGAAQVTEELMLVESDGPISAGSSWSAGVVEFRDKRLAPAASDLLSLIYNA